MLAARKVFCDEALRQKDRKHSAVFSLNNYWWSATSESPKGVFAGRPTIICNIAKIYKGKKREI
ncbi:MAG: hypothetical protein FWG87_14920 [Defluviitaleaceae bacterium]|nr:hypothetical protein [Defluviitaleaceae bacterium]